MTTERLMARAREATRSASLDGRWTYAALEWRTAAGKALEDGDHETAGRCMMMESKMRDEAGRAAADRT